MPQNTTIAIPTGGAPVRVTTSAVTALRLQNQSGGSIMVMATVGTTAPTDAAGAIALSPGETILPDVALTVLFPGVTGANHVWVRARAGGQVSVSHA